jgi:hypothetical protein
MYETSAKSVNWHLAEQARLLQYTLREGFVVAKFARGESASGTTCFAPLLQRSRIKVKARDRGLVTF